MPATSVYPLSRPTWGLLTCSDDLQPHSVGTCTTTDHSLLCSYAAAAAAVAVVVLAQGSGRGEALRPPPGHSTAARFLAAASLEDNDDNDDEYGMEEVTLAEVPQP